MRTLSAILLIAASLTNAIPTGKHNTFIENTLWMINNDDHLLKAEISVPDVVVNRYIPSPKDLKQALIQHVEQAAKEFSQLSAAERDEAVINLPRAYHSSQVNKTAVAMAMAPKIIKREVNENFDVEATAALYKQALDFLDKYDVELRLD